MPGEPHSTGIRCFWLVDVSRSQGLGVTLSWAAPAQTELGTFMCICTISRQRPAQSMSTIPTPVLDQAADQSGTLSTIEYTGSAVSLPRPALYIEPFVAQASLFEARFWDMVGMPTGCCASCMCCRYYSRTAGLCLHLLDSSQLSGMDALIGCHNIAMGRVSL